MEDLEPLAGALLARIGAEAGRALALSPDALRAMRGYSWPGNVRELENALRYATAMCEGQTLGVEHLPPPLGDAEAPKPAAGGHGDSDGDEAARIRAALDDNHWRRADAARALGISRTTLWRRMQALGIG
jgi:DNA-binding NtrC family response regulator